MNRYYLHELIYVNCWKKRGDILQNIFSRVSQDQPLYKQSVVLFWDVSEKFSLHQPLFQKYEPYVCENIIQYKTQFMEIHKTHCVLSNMLENVCYTSLTTILEYSDTFRFLYVGSFVIRTEINSRNMEKVSIISVGSRESALISPQTGNLSRSHGLLVSIRRKSVKVRLNLINVFGFRSLQ